MIRDEYGRIAKRNMSKGHGGGRVPTPFAVAVYEEYPIYEPAEGGYYYEGRNCVMFDTYDTYEEALREYRNRRAEVIDVYGDRCYEVNDYSTHTGKTTWLYSKYIGDGAQVRLERPWEFKTLECGWKPYC